MSERYSSGEAAARGGMTRDALLHALRMGAPEPKTPRVGGRRMFSDADIERICKWRASRRRVPVGA